MRRRLTTLVAVAIVAAACGSDDAVEPAGESRTTVPEVTAAPDDQTDNDALDDEAEPTDEPDDQPDEPDDADEPEPTTAPLQPAGDPTQASIELDPLVALEQPIDAVIAPNGEWWVAERPGRVVVVDPDTGDVGDLVLDINDETTAQGERGLLGLAVDDDALYANFTQASNGTTRVDAWLLDDSGRPGERRMLLEIEQPFGNHNGGSLAIGPDGHLYIGVGDGGAADDPLLAGQDPDQILGSILRIDPTPAADEPYAIPADNPYADGGGEPEIFLIGARNPWRFSFDPVTDDLWVADVGQNLWEEITLLLGDNGWGLGANLGWNLREGTERFAGDRPEGNVDPVFVYGRAGDPAGCSITGGEVYRGTAIPELFGAYLFGDYCTSRLWAVSVATGEVVFADLGVQIPGRELVDFATLPDGEIVAMSLAGEIVRIVPA